MYVGKTDDEVSLLFIECSGAMFLETTLKSGCKDDLPSETGA